MMRILVPPQLVKVLEMKELGLILKEAAVSINMAEEKTIMQRYVAGVGFLLSNL
jgi:hypothetical protein